MDDVTIPHAKQHLEDLIERARRGEDVRISDPKLGTVRLTPADATQPQAARPERRPGRWKDRIPDPPPDFFAPMTEEELKDWYGAD